MQARANLAVSANGGSLFQLGNIPYHIPSTVPYVIQENDIPTVVYAINVM